MADELEPTGEEQPQDAGADQPAGDAANQRDPDDQTPDEPVADAGEAGDAEAPDAMAEEALRAAREAVGSLGGGGDADVATPDSAAEGDSDDEPMDDAAAAALAAVKAAIGDASGAGAPVSDAPLSDAGVGGAGLSDAGGGAAFDLPSFDELAASVVNAPEGIDLLSDVDLNVKIELGRTKMLVEDVLRLGEGAVVELDKLAGDPVDVYVNERLVARGEVLVLNDNFCVRVNEVIDPDAERSGQKAG